jgi:enediyne biosynthesis protein E4
MQLELTGTKSHCSAIGTVVRLTIADGTQSPTLHSGSSYCSASDLALTFGLRRDASAAAIEIEWPSGTRQKHTSVAKNRRVVIQEP